MNLSRLNFAIKSSQKSNSFKIDPKRDKEKISLIEFNPFEKFALNKNCCFLKTTKFYEEFQSWIEAV